MPSARILAAIFRPQANVSMPPMWAWKRSIGSKLSRRTGEDVKKGFEQIKDFSLGGLVPPLQVTAADHQGGGWVQIFQVKGGKFVKETDWFRAYPEVVAEAVSKAE